ncbi:hypothetical protein B5S29_g5665 [[Candida] boidinii]|nr:hypothetical protein B5S29_g5665 [[Candida] boidinii]
MGHLPLTVEYPPTTTLRPFGCKVFALTDPAKRPSKFTPATQEGILVGYSSIHKAYRVYLPSTHQIHISNNCRFDESEYPATDASSGIPADSSEIPSGSALFGPATSAIPTPVTSFGIPPKSMPEADSTDSAVDPSYAPSPSVSSDEGSIPLPPVEAVLYAGINPNLTIWFSLCNICMIT